MDYLGIAGGIGAIIIACAQYVISQKRARIVERLIANTIKRQAAGLREQTRLIECLQELMETYNDQIKSTIDGGSGANGGSSGPDINQPEGQKLP